MSDDRHLDGNALGGVFYDLFGRDMTAELGCCAHCGAINAVGSLHVYRSAGDVVRCPDCGSALIVMVQREDRIRVSFESISWLEAHV